LLCFEYDLLAEACSSKGIPEEDKEIIGSEVPSPPPADKEDDLLQRNVDPNFLVSSGGKNPPPRRMVPTLRPTRGEVSVQNIVFVHVLGVSMLNLCRHLQSMQKQSATQQLSLVLEQEARESFCIHARSVRHMPDWQVSSWQGAEPRSCRGAAAYMTSGSPSCG
jgi:hypothetical protein